MKNILKRIFHAKKGVTILEGLIALGLLALVATGTFGVLLSVSRQSTSPDIREEMVWAVERAHSQLQMYAYSSGFGHYSSQRTPYLPDGLCGCTGGADCINDSDPLGTGIHDIDCMLPPICDRNDSSFSYKVVTSNINIEKNSYFSSTPGMVGMVEGLGHDRIAPMKSIEFSITCNGFTL